jgi:opacity protein-like surface antigen
MKTKVIALVACISTVAVLASAADSVPPRIAWYGTLSSGLAEAERSGRPILLVSGAPQCLGVSGIW